MLCKIADLIAEVPEAGGLAPAVRIIGIPVMKNRISLSAKINTIIQGICPVRVKNLWHIWNECVSEACK